MSRATLAFAALVSSSALALACKSSPGVPLDHRPSDPPCAVDGGVVVGACNVDSDCPDGGVCVCATPGDGTTPATTANACLPAGNCRLDSDCSPVHYCSPSSTGCLLSISYYCHTPADDCSNDSDCREDQFCQFVPAAGGGGKWTCVSATACE